MTHLSAHATQALMALCLALLVSLALLPRRVREGTPIAVPVGVVVLGVVRLVLIGVTIFHLKASFPEVARAPAEARAAVLQQAIDRAMPFASFGINFELPLLLAAWIADVQLRKRHRSKPKVGAALPAPAGASCATHAGDVATRICARCGSFMCAPCAAANGSLCGPCSAR